MDLSAAFELIRPGIFASKAKKILRNDSLAYLVQDFITDRKAFVETGSGVSSFFKFSAGCPQGSTLGPKVFNLYCYNLIDVIGDKGFLVTYADDSYVVVDGVNDEDLQKRLTDVMKIHL